MLVLLLFISPLSAAYAGDIVVNGEFSDWDGQPCVDDLGGETNNTDDLVKFCFVADQDAEITYFFVQRVGDSNSPLDANIKLDMNNDGDVTDPEDRNIDIKYNLNNNTSLVDVDLYDGQGNFLVEIANKENWGDSGTAGGARVEMSLTFAQLGIVPGLGAAISMQVGSTQGSTVVDTVIEVQWTPANALGDGLLIGILIAASLGMAYLVIKKQREAATSS